MALQWSLNLRDSMSGPAARAATGMQKVERALMRTDRAGDATRASIDKVVGAMNRLDRAQDRVSSTVGNANRNLVGATKTTGGLSAGVGVLTGIVGGATAAVAGLASELARMAAGAAFKELLRIKDLQGFKTSTIFAFEKIAGTKEEAQEIFDMAAATSLDIGADLQTSIGTMNQLLARGFKAPHADKLVRQMADLQTLNPKTNIEQLVNAIAQIKGKGTLQLEELQQQLGESLPVEKVIAQLSKSRGKTDAEIRKLISAGQISGDEGIAAIEAAITEMTGGKSPGAIAAEKANTTLDGTIARAKNLRDQLYAALDIDWSPAINALKNIMGAMKSEKGAAFFKSIETAINTLLSKLGAMSAEDWANLFERAGRAIEDVAKILASFADDATKDGGKLTRLLDLFDRIGGIFDRFGGIIDYILDPIGTIKDELGALGGIVEYYEDPFGKLGETFSSLGSAVSGGLQAALFAVQSSIGGVFGMILGQAYALGAGIIDGIISGITSGASGVVDAITSTVQGAIDTAKSLLKQNSPSRVFINIFKGVGEGSAIGVEKSAPWVHEATRRMGQESVDEGQRAAAATHELGVQATNAGRAAATRISNTTATNNSRTIQIGAVNMQGGGSPGESARALRSELRALQMSHG